MLNAITGCLFIFLARLTDVSMCTVRTIFVVRGKRFYAALIGFFEVIIYILALNEVVNTLDNPLNLLAYAFGFAAGNYCGSYIEEKMAIGDSSVQIVFSKDDEEIIDTLREEGFGVTVMDGIGRNGSKKISLISLKRKDLPRLLEMVDDLDKSCFVTVMDTRTTKGGYFKRHRKGK